MKQKNLRFIFAKAVRIITVAPVFATLLVLILFFFKKAYTPLHALFAILFLGIFPLLSYPVSLVFQKDNRRKKQRNLAIVFSVIGYIAGVVFCFFTSSGSAEKTIYLTYLLSGVLIALFSFVFHIKTSGHACGVAGPIAALCLFNNPLFILGIVFLIPVYRSSLILKRHTVKELIMGTVIPVICLMISYAFAA